MKELETFIKDLGFPIFVAVYMMFVSSKQLRGLTKALQELKEALRFVCKKD